VGTRLLVAAVLVAQLHALKRPRLHRVALAEHVIDHPETGGVGWTTWYSGVISESRSTLKPSFSE
jgi:hypothetical protein